MIDAARIRRLPFPQLPVAVALILALLLAACRTIPVETQERATGDPTAYAAFATRPLRVVEDAIPETGPIARNLQAQLGALIEERGYRAGDTNGRALVFQLAVSQERVTRRTWSSDPDASAYVLREVDEAVLVLGAADAASNAEVWRGVARARLRSPELAFGPSREEVWLDALAQLVARLPAR